MPVQPGQTHVMLMNLPERLRALPDYDPPAGGWQRLSARMDARRRHWVTAGSGLALAASVLVAVGLGALRPLTETTAPVVPPVRTASAPSDVARLIGRSQALESQLRQARPQVAVWDSGRARQAELLEGELSLVDARLGFAGADTDPAEIQRLWRTRVQLMNALLRLHQTEAPALQYASYQY